MELKKVVLKLGLHDTKEKQKAMKAVTTLSGIESISMDMNEKQLIVVGDVDPVDIVRKLRKLWHADILTVGPAKEPEKKEEPKKEEAKKDDGKKEEEKKKDESEKCYNPYYTQCYNPYYTQYYHVYYSAE